VITRTIDSVIERRLLVNYRIDPERVAAFLPRPFLIRMSRVRPARVPPIAGLASENLAHRFAVEWDDAEGTHTGVYVPRRETSSRFAATVGHRLFPGAYHLARFQVRQSDVRLRVDVRSLDGKVALSAEVTPAAGLRSELFQNVDAAIDFFRRGDRGFSPSPDHACLDSVSLHAASWAARPMSIARMRSSLFDDPAAFPDGACALDSALLMTNIAARWTADAGPDRKHWSRARLLREPGRAEAGA
jgi:hypothetical protein